MESKKVNIDIIKDAIVGNAMAFEMLCCGIAKSVLFTASSLMGNKEDGEDVAQEVLLKIHSNISRLKDPKLFYIWLHKIIRNECATMGRKKAILKLQCPIEKYENTLKETTIELLPHEYLENAEQAEDLMRAIDCLKPIYKEVIIYFYYEGLSYAEISAIIQKSQKSVENCLMRARKNIRKNLNAKFDSVLGKRHMLIPAPILSSALEMKMDNAFSPEAIQNFLEVNKQLLPTAATSVGLAAHAVPASGAALAAKGTASGFALAAKVAAGVAVGAVLATTSVLSITQPTINASVPPSNYVQHATPQQEASSFAREGEFQTKEELPVVSEDVKTPEPVQQVEKENNAAKPSPIPTDSVEEQNNYALVPTMVGGKMELKNSQGQILEQTERDLSGINLLLLNESKQVLGQSQTDTNGNFSFSSLELFQDENMIIELEMPLQNNLTVTGDNPNGSVSILVKPGVQATAILYITDTSLPYGEILFTGADGGYVQVNPSMAQIQSPNNYLLGNWTIQDETGATLYSGSGLQVTNELVSLKELRADGTYTLCFIITNDVGNSAEIKKTFIIDSEESPDNQHE